MSLRSPLGRVRGLGSAKTGTDHFWAQRVTAVALVPLTLWFVYALLSLAGADYATVSAWLRSPVNAVLMLALAYWRFRFASKAISARKARKAAKKEAKLARKEPSIVDTLPEPTPPNRNRRLLEAPRVHRSLRSRAAA